MKKCELWPILDNQEKQLKQVKSISQLAYFAGGLEECPKNALSGSLSVMCEMLE